MWTLLIISVPIPFVQMWTQNLCLCTTDVQMDVSSFSVFRKNMQEEKGSFWEDNLVWHLLMLVANMASQDLSKFQQCGIQYQRLQNHFPMHLEEAKNMK